MFDSTYLQEYEVKQFYLTFDHVENLRNLVGLNCTKEKFCYKKVVFHYFLPAIISFLSQIFVSTSTSHALYLSSRKVQFFKLLASAFLSLNQGAHLHSISHAHAFDVIHRQFVERAVTFAEWKSSVSQQKIKLKSLQISQKLKNMTEN